MMPSSKAVATTVRPAACFGSRVNQTEFDGPARSAGGGTRPAWDRLPRLRRVVAFLSRRLIHLGQAIGFPVGDDKRAGRGVRTIAGTVICP